MSPWSTTRRNVMSSEMERLEKQMEFIKEVDSLKNINRRSYVLDGSRNENDAEHSWHISLMAFLLSEHSNDPDIDIPKVIRMLLIHDIVEIDAGDTFAYDEEGNRTKVARERECANRIFNILPQDQAAELLSLWEEFEARATPEAKFAASLDRLQPMLLNHGTEGRTWKEHGVKASQVRSRNGHIREGSDTIWTFASSIIDDSVDREYLDE